MVPLTHTNTSRWPCLNLFQRLQICSTFFLVFSTLLSTSWAGAELVEVQAIRGSDGLTPWHQSFQKKVSKMRRNPTYLALGYRECASVQEIPGVYLCLNYTTLGMARGLARASIFIEGLGKQVSALPFPKGTLLPLDSPALENYSNAIQGMDLKGQDLQKFYDVLLRKCADTGDVNWCPNKYEQEMFEQFVLPHFQRDQHFVVITHALVSKTPYQNIVSHEIMHAQYFLQPPFRKVAGDFWSNEMSEGERQEVRSHRRQGLRNPQTAGRTARQSLNLFIARLISCSLGQGEVCWVPWF